MRTVLWLLALACSVAVPHLHSQVVNKTVVGEHAKLGRVSATEVRRAGIVVYRRILSQPDSTGRYAVSHEVIYSFGKPAVVLQNGPAGYSVNCYGATMEEVFVYHPPGATKPTKIAVVSSSEWVDLFLLGEDGYFTVASDEESERFSQNWFASVSRKMKVPEEAKDTFFDGIRPGASDKARP